MGRFSIAGVHEWLSHDAFGRIKPADEGPNGSPSVTDPYGRVELQSARGGYSSFRLLVLGAGEYRIETSGLDGLEVDLFRAWYHPVRAPDGQTIYLPDALIPLDAETAITVPDPANGIAGQTAQEIWVDVYVPADAVPGAYEGHVSCAAGVERETLTVRLLVGDAVIPERPRILIDHNSYGARWLGRLYQVDDGDTERIISLLHHYYRLVREHRGVFHNLGASHSGSVPPLYAPGVRGSAGDLELCDWGVYDRHFGPLFSGAAFAAAAPGMTRTRMRPDPLETVYTPFTPSWPASYIKWGERGYEVELTRGLRQFDRHLADNGWDGTTLEFFFNHKKRYRWYSWDGDEVKYPEDFVFHDEMSRVFESATSGARAPWVYRFDASWQMERQFRRYAGRKNFWVSGGMHRWYPEPIAEALERGERVSWYGELPPIDAADTSVLGALYETWARGLSGHCLWLTTSPDEYTWGECSGHRTANMYPGERFGIDGPIPSIRLKIQRNGIQDIDLLPDTPEAHRRLKDAVPIEIWRDRPPAAKIMDPSLWDSANLEYEHEPVHQDDGASDPFWWREIRGLRPGRKQ